MAERLFYSMGEVSEMFDVNPSLLRHWETQFSILRPKRNKKGNRLYSPADVEHLKLIYHLVKERGMTLDGARKALKESRGRREVPRDLELLERLQRVRAMLAEVKTELHAEEGELLPATDEAFAAAPDRPEGAEPECPAPETTSPARDEAARPAPKTRKNARKAVVKIEPQEASAAQTDAAPGAEAAGAATKPAGQRRPRRKKEEAEHKELFAFYEQSLF